MRTKLLVKGFLFLFLLSVSSYAARSTVKKPVINSVFDYKGKKYIKYQDVILADSRAKERVFVDGNLDRIVNIGQTAERGFRFMGTYDSALCHEVYIGIYDGEGKFYSQSEPFKFGDLTKCTVVNPVNKPIIEKVFTYKSKRYIRYKDVILKDSRAKERVIVDGNLDRIVNIGQTAERTFSFFGTYDLNKCHEVYIEIYDGEGKLHSQSEPFKFGDLTKCNVVNPVNKPIIKRVFTYKNKSYIQYKDVILEDSRAKERVIIDGNLDRVVNIGQTAERTFSFLGTYDLNKCHEVYLEIYDGEGRLFSKSEVYQFGDISNCGVIVPSKIVQYHRVIWDRDPAHNATIGFTPNSNNVGMLYVKYGYSTDESIWNQKEVDFSATFNNLLESKFVHLTGLIANSKLHYRVCDDTGCGQNFWFRTAPLDNSSFVVIAGGDTRTGLSSRRAGNKIIAKVRPLFVMHGGDYTGIGAVSELSKFFKDWKLTFSSDNIDGIPYKRIYPLVPAHGNHENANYKLLCAVFGVDSNQDGICSPSDTYGAFSVSPLLRVYTLNSEFVMHGWDSYATEMNNWFNNDVSTKGKEVKWRMVQYHRSMFPHYSGKPINPTFFSWWAESFYTNLVNLVVESDTHLFKITKAVKPSGNIYAVTNTGGTVYIGEGSWGAPSRPADRRYPWTYDLASIQQFKVLTIKPNKLEIRTAQFDATADTLTKADRDNNRTLLPANVNWWISGNSETVNLVQSPEGRSIIQ